VPLHTFYYNFTELYPIAVGKAKAGLSFFSQSFSEKELWELRCKNFKRKYYLHPTEKAYL